jgi:hypothetical protein
MSTVTLVEVSGSLDKNRMTSDVITRIPDKLAINNMNGTLDEWRSHRQKLFSYKRILPSESGFLHPI